ncbi:MAG: hypothetical protein A2X61_06470 [Ignavibacteria bacterium GWB2_35_12]|nr:MAG: hypothetical protein A2X63_10635 [Ignavibacteria bacterium GWA2_35_8]OGU40967.1 MAG: hypothetical protein A2X61_06470 [Ignavibacteria bacterium GWB2_35_12]OGU92569.1 MAG: hypothetical protein A2220_02375 [Ignavibacteria bacterium RIFOXYA2_FULL_35_10]OGV19745.1 MAG: hypothetical protein A2475_00585 [Ignavibacteria bacterium RIFOXYC2_FULL_35_21]
MEIESILLFESERVDYLYPFSILHCAWEVRCGAFMLFEKIQKQFPDARIIYKGRVKHVNSFLARYEHKPQDLRKENTLVLSASLMPDKAFWDNIFDAYSQFQSQNSEKKSVVFRYQNFPIAAYIPKNELINPTDFDKQFLPKFLYKFAIVLPQIDIDEPKVINFLWDAIEYNSSAIEDDFRFFNNITDFDILKKSGVFLLNKDKIKIDKTAKIAPTVVIDASEGPVIIENEVTIMPQSTIYGPCFIGSNSIVKVGAKIFSKTSIGPWCKVGGEVENAIIQSYSNKQHDGYLGHSYLCEWVNLGAGTNTSDLKNTYGNINVQLGDKEINTERMFLGLLCGDHTKSAINTAFTTGTTAGIFGILVSDGFLPNTIPSFAWRGTKGCTHYKIEKALETAHIVMQRRNKTLLSDEIELIKQEYKTITSPR